MLRFSVKLTGDFRAVGFEVYIGFVLDDGTDTDFFELPAEDVDFIDIDSAQFVGERKAVHARVDVQPEFDFWPSSAFIDLGMSSVEISCEAIDRAGPLSWWHSCVGIIQPCSPRSQIRGAGIKVGIVDSDLHSDTGPLSDVYHAGHALKLKSWTGDKLHGSLVSSFMVGIEPSCIYEGMCPGSEFIFMSAADADGSGELNPVAVAEAIDCLSFEHQCDLITISAGDNESELPIVREAVLDAYENGTLCIFAAGNVAETVGYPALYPDVLAVGALGGIGCVPVTSRAYLYEYDQMLPDENGNFYISPRMSFGEEVNLFAPGIGVIADFGDGHLYVATGTSYAAPIAAGVLAARLALDLKFRNRTGSARSARAVDVLGLSAYPISFSDGDSGRRFALPCLRYESTINAPTAR